jgi:hypothetical protein
VVVDAAAGRRIKRFGLGRLPSYFDLTTLPGPGGAGAPRLAVLLQRPSGATRVVLRDAATGARMGGVGFGKAVAPTALAALTGPDGDALLAVLGNRGDGSMRAIVRRAADRTLVTTLPLATDLSAGDAAAITLPGGSTLLVAVGAAPGDGPVRLITGDPAAGGTVAAFPVPGLSSALDLAALGDLGGGPSPDVAVLGRGPAGPRRVVILDPLTGTVLNTLNLSPDYSADDLTYLLRGNHLAVLGETATGELLVTVFHAPTGAALSSFTVP